MFCIRYMILDKYVSKQDFDYYWQYPELNALIMRRFQESGDVEKAFDLVHKSNGLEQTKFMAKKHCMEAIRIAQSFVKSPYQKALIVLPDLVLNRMK